jgi:hypothetical protein
MNAKQFDAVTGNVKDGNIFTNIQAAIKQQLEAQIRKSFQSLERKISTQCRAFRENIELATVQTLTADNQQLLENFEKERLKLAQALVDLKTRHEAIVKSAGLEKVGGKAGRQATVKPQ